MAKTKTPIVAIVGQANVGKSSLFNALLKSRQAIVAREAGTTRDSVTAKLSIKDKDMWLVDTAGLKAAEDEFEATIQEQITEAVQAADLILVLVDASQPLTQQDRQVAKIALKSQKPVFLLASKEDKAHRLSQDDFKALGIRDIFLTSNTTRRGLEELQNEIYKQLPKKRITQKQNYIKVALLGRPNVGKSALFNSLLKKQSALVSDRAGTTRDVNRRSVNYMDHQIELLDTAGIRRPGKIEKGIEKFSVLRSLSAIEEADVCLLLCDVNEVGVVLDQKIGGLIKEAGKGAAIIISKWDSLDNKDTHTHGQIAAQMRHHFDFMPWAPMILTSSISGQNVSKVFEIALQIYQQRQQVIKTSILNRWLSQQIIKHPPAGLKNSHPKLQYATQATDESTPTFMFFGKELGLLHWSYKRYLERNLRSEFGFEGTAVRLIFKDNQSPNPYLNK